LYSLSLSLSLSYSLSLILSHSHFLSSPQSCTRGFLVRQKWKVNPQFVVDELHSKMEKERIAKNRTKEARQRLAVGVFSVSVRIAP
jgi:hypothetical protein